MYTVGDYGGMIDDSGRMKPYEEALRRAIRPGSVVLDMGTGTGICALLACRFGARRVFALEPDDVIQTAREHARANGFADRIEFIQELSTRVTLPERADVIVSDLRGLIPVFGQHLPSILDARRRLLAPGGHLIPRRDILHAAPVEAPKLYREHLGPADGVRLGFDMRAAQRVVSNQWRRARVRPQELLAEPKPWVTLDYAVVEDVHVDAPICWTAARNGVAHGFILWFDCQLSDDFDDAEDARKVYFSNSPCCPGLIYHQVFFPWPEPVPITEGTTISVRLSAHLIGGDYVWRWNTRLASSSGRLSGGHLMEFQQSTFLGMAVSRDSLRKQAAHHIPELKTDGLIDQFILKLMDGRASLAEVARLVHERFPAEFRRPMDALTRVGELSQRYSR